MKFYPLKDWPKSEDYSKLNIETKGLDSIVKSNLRKRIAAIKTGEFREPKAGEWFLSGAIVEAYRANNDLLTKYHIAKLILTETITTTKIINK
jgi:hypothetical protein